MSSKPRWQQCFLQHDFWQQPLLQPVLQPQDASAAAAQPQFAAALQPQAGSAAQAGSQAFWQPQLASQAGAAQVLQPLLQQLFLQQLWQSNKPRRPSNKQQWWQRFLQHDFWQQPVLQPVLQPHEGSAAQPQLFAAAQHEGSAAAAQPQLFAAAHDGSQAFSQPQVGSQALWQQLLHPQSFRPNMRSKSSAPKLWLHRPTLTTSAPKIIFHFI